MTAKKIWECKIGEVDSVAGGADYPMRQAVAAAYREITGAEPVFIFSGWGALLTEAERAVVENRLPAPATAPELSQHDDLDKVATARYKVVKSKSTIWPCSVVAGDGEQELFSGSESTCKHVARKLTGAFLDGAFYSQSTATLQSATAPAQPSWHDAPTSPGLWINSSSDSIRRVDQHDIDHIMKTPPRGWRWYGPIPEDKP